MLVISIVKQLPGWKVPKKKTECNVCVKQRSSATIKCLGDDAKFSVTKPQEHLLCMWGPMIWC